MKKIFILAEHKKGHLKKSTLELLEASKGQEVSAAIFGSNAEASAKELAEKGVQNVFWIKDAAFDNYHPQAFAAVLEDLIGQAKPAFVLGTASSFGKDILPKVSAHFDAPIACDCTELSIEPELKVRRPFYAGKALADIVFESHDMIFITMRANSLQAGAVSETAGTVKEHAASYDFASSAVQFVKKTEAASDRPDLSEANVIVSAGRSIKSAENFKMIEEMADILGGAVGASRAAVDEGMTTHDRQVGQTGKTVSPSLYIACGISGAIQHLAGMRTSKVIVAINKDETAPLFSKSDYGIVGDLFEIVPLVNQEFKKLLHK
jgi:electron transfer flavoprotein alpha subunit